MQHVQDLARRGAVVHMVCRNAERGQKAVKDVIAATGNEDVHLQVCARWSTWPTPTTVFCHGTHV